MGYNPLANQECGLGEVLVEDLTVPEMRKVALYLATGINGGESGLGRDSQGGVRPHENPCP